MKKALLQMHLAVLLWGFTGILGKAITLDAPMLVWYRMLLTALIMAVILFYRKQWVRIPKGDLGRLAMIGGLMALHWVAFYGAIKLANASIALVCLSTTPVFTSLLDPLINKGKFNTKEALLGMLAIGGMYLIYQFQQFYAAGILAGIIAAMLAALFTVLNKRIAHKYPARTMVFYEMGTGWLVLTVLMPFYILYTSSPDLWPNQISLSQLSVNFPHTLALPNDWIWLIVLALCCTVWAQSLALNALKELSAFTSTLSVNLEPVYGILLAFVFYKENQELNWSFYLGMLLIAFSVILQMITILKLKKPHNYIKDRGGID